MKYLSHKNHFSFNHKFKMELLIITTIQQFYSSQWKHRCKTDNRSPTFLASSRVSSFPDSDFLLVLSASLVTSSKIKSFSSNFSSFSASRNSSSSIFFASTSGSGSWPPRRRIRLSSEGSSSCFSSFASLSRQATSWKEKVTLVFFSLSLFQSTWKGLSGLFL